MVVVLLVTHHLRHCLRYLTHEKEVNALVGVLVEINKQSRWRMRGQLPVALPVVMGLFGVACHYMVVQSVLAHMYLQEIYTSY